MRKDQFAPVFKKLTIAYAGKLAYSEENLDLWFELLRDLPAEITHAAALDYMTSPAAFPPTPGQIRSGAVEILKRANKVPSAAEAWEIVLRAPVSGQVKWSEETADGWVIYEADYAFDHPIVEKVCRNLGWPDRFWTDNLSSDRARFLQAYETEMTRATIAERSLPEVKSLIESGNQKMIGERNDRE